MARKSLELLTESMFYVLMSLLRGERCGLVIPWDHIRRIGDDVILVSTAGCAQTSPGWEMHE